MNISGIYFALAVAVAVISIIALVVALVGDRSKGRKRCRRCWYDMSGSSGLTCSECSWTARSDIALFATRRHRTVALGAMAACLFSAGVAQFTFHLEDWEPILPISLLIVVSERGDGEWANSVLLSRIKYAESAHQGMPLSDRQWKRLGNLILGQIESDPQSVTAVQVSLLQTAHRWHDDPAMRSRSAAAAPLLFHHSDSASRWRAAFFAVDPADPLAVLDETFARAQSDDPSLRSAGYLTLHALSGHGVELDLLVQGMMLDPDQEARVNATICIDRLIDSGSPPRQLMDALLKYNESPFSVSRYWRVRFLVKGLAGHEREQFVVAHLSCDDARRAAMVALTVPANRWLLVETLPVITAHFAGDSEVIQVLLDCMSHATGIPRTAPADSIVAEFRQRYGQSH